MNSKSQVARTLPTLPASVVSAVRDRYDRGAEVVRSLEERSRIAGRQEFVDRSRGQTTLIIILAGYKQDLWDIVFPRIAASCPDNSDVCLVSAGKYDGVLSRLAAENSWSYLTTNSNDVSLVQNLAIQRHPDADVIVKIDEDIIVTENTVTELVAYYQSVLRSGIYDPAFVAPTLNLNGFCYRDLLEYLNLLDRYEVEFGQAKVATRGIAITESHSAAQWVWENCGTVDEVARLLRDRDPSPQLAGVQFSIGLIAFSRAFWKEIGRFPVYWHRLALGKSTLGADEEYICRKAIFMGRPMVVAPTIFAGHFSFGRQYEPLVDLLRVRPEIFVS